MVSVLILIFALLLIAGALKLGIVGGVVNPSGTEPDRILEKGIYTNGESSAAIAVGKLVYKENADNQDVLLTADAKPIGRVGVALSAAAAGQKLRVAWAGRVTAADIDGGVFDTNAVTAAGDSIMPAAAGAMATCDSVAKRTIGYAPVKSATVGVLVLTGQG